MAPHAPPTTRHAPPPILRADAQRNRDAVLASAREIFAQEGLDAPLNEIARRAGVGQGTLYRRFATREALIEAIADDYLAELRDVARRAGTGPGAFTVLFEGAASLQSENQGLIDLLAAHPLPEQILRERRNAFLSIFEAPLHAAQKARLVRDDLKTDDVRLLLRMVGAASRDTDQRDGFDRSLELVSQALRP
jgi:AcrR family transcriptional regulator